MLQCWGRMSREGELSKCVVHKGGEGGEDDEGDDDDFGDKAGGEPWGTLPVSEDLVIWEI